MKTRAVSVRRPYHFWIEKFILFYVIIEGNTESWNIISLLSICIQYDKNTERK